MSSSSERGTWTDPAAVLTTATSAESSTSSPECRSPLRVAISAGVAPRAAQSTRDCQTAMPLLSGACGAAGRLLRVLVDRVAVMGGELAGDLIFGFRAGFGRQVAPFSLVLEFFWIDLAGRGGAFDHAVLGGRAGAIRLA